VTCSGGLALLACGAVRPLLQRCSLQGRKGGLLLCGRSAAQLQRCSIQQCGEAGVKVGSGPAARNTDRSSCRLTLTVC
jgi:hypothetical protein